MARQSQVLADLC